ncbi:type II toxin-antitoxin system RatA family toxin [Thiomicrorhabdus aquaedulcis]|uniref:type II toxin-antitoxin system RatA family toxin n=1 Tax=Thiomicrorhabdus aquaedulcis TaxID=2211106 RepID=UPI000FD9A463|nr:type II toxin-antitoxin system RatA family toxin [Thiomicrorhabdus aquaedulcis]
MKKITRSALLPYSATQIYNLVNDVNAYPAFLPWCGGARVVSQNGLEMIAEVTIAKAGIKQTFRTRNHLVPPERIGMQLEQGPFKALTGEWTFKALDVDACKIFFEVEFEVNSLLGLALGPIFEHIASTMVDSFCERAKHVYG